MVQVKLSEFLLALELNSSDYKALVNLQSGEIFFITEEALDIARNETKDYPDWQKVEIQNAQDYLKNPENYRVLPSQGEVNEYRLMEDFAYNLEDKNQRQKLEEALRGKGAFQRFKGTIAFLGVEKDWYSFREEQCKRFALDWCEQKGFEVVDS